MGYLGDALSHVISQCIDGLLAVLRSPHMVAVTKMVTKMVSYYMLVLLVI